MAIKLELRWSNIKRVIMVPRGLNLEDLNNVIQAMFGFENDHLWNFRNKAGKVWDSGCDPFTLDMDMRGVLDLGAYCIEDVLVDSKEKHLYSYDYGDGWKIVVSHMADSKGYAIACEETVRTNVMEDIGGVGRLKEFTELLASRFFGHEKGAFTGAERQTDGLFQMANGGTLFLDEIGELLPEAQALLLRVLEGGRFMRVGGKEEIEVDVRLITATNRNLPLRVRDGKFRADLFQRLNVVQLRIPSLREHKEDMYRFLRSLLTLAVPP